MNDVSGKRENKEVIFQPRVERRQSDEQIFAKVSIVFLPAEVGRVHLSRISSDNQRHLSQLIRQVNLKARLLRGPRSAN